MLRGDEGLQGDPHHAGQHEHGAPVPAEGLRRTDRPHARRQGDERGHCQGQRDCQEHAGRHADGAVQDPGQRQGAPEHHRAGDLPGHKGQGGHHRLRGRHWRDRDRHRAVPQGHREQLQNCGCGAHREPCAEWWKAGTPQDPRHWGRIYSSRHGCFPGGPGDAGQLRAGHDNGKEAPERRGPVHRHLCRGGRACRRRPCQETGEQREADRRHHPLVWRALPIQPDVQ
mmetsp:Transcript_96540/g.166416  ORF Transcript_96540/g.166416 Transcript_96540/m.166416 type:complete len:227 (-) Transcript_96540:271-951(-)